MIEVKNRSEEAWPHPQKLAAFLQACFPWTAGLAAKVSALPCPALPVEAFPAVTLLPTQLCAGPRAAHVAEPSHVLPGAQSPLPVG